MCPVNQAVKASRKSTDKLYFGLRTSSINLHHLFSSVPPLVRDKSVNPIPLQLDFIWAQYRKIHGHPVDIKNTAFMCLGDF